jgi:DNA polymerase delta subunit 3
MKKKTTKDAEGYLVTKEEMAWESFSESDKETNAKKTKVAVKPAVAESKGGKKAPAKKGQGNIMSFFGKK